jgi:hypothetical protein
MNKTTLSDNEKRLYNVIKNQETISYEEMQELLSSIPYRQCGLNIEDFPIINNVVIFDVFRKKPTPDGYIKLLQLLATKQKRSTKIEEKVIVGTPQYNELVKTLNEDLDKHKQVYGDLVFTGTYYQGKMIDIRGQHKIDKIKDAILKILSNAVQIPQTLKPEYTIRKNVSLQESYEEAQALRTN